ncbi:MAG TPA: chromosome segregation protein SMC [Gemmatimonadales bacterium]
MKLTRLELSGFKSFADTVTLNFEEGVTAIVGPNGCGKSNVSDAVRWVLGEQSARLLRGGKMEDVIFQGSTARRPVNVTEVSLHLDNVDGTLPIGYQEVVVTRRLSRSGHSEYLLNNAPVRLRDIQDLLRGTGMGSDAGVVIEAKMIDLLLSDRADERRSLFEEAAAIGLYRDRKYATERRLEETAADLQRLEDLLNEVQSQIRSLARQKGRAERHAKLTEEKFTVQLTLARRLLDRLAEQASDMEARYTQLSTDLPGIRRDLAEKTSEQEQRARERATAEAHRGNIQRELSEAQIALAKLDADIAVAAERASGASQRRQRADEERRLLELRSQQAQLEEAAAGSERSDAEREHQQIQLELSGRSTTEDEMRQRLTRQRELVRRLEQELAACAQSLRSLEGERGALDGELASLRERAEVAAAHRQALQADLGEAERRSREAAEVAAVRARDAQAAAADAERARHLLAGTREREVGERAVVRQAEESLAQLSARRQALEELERDRVGLAPGAAALLAERHRFGEGILGPLSDYLSSERQDAELAERLLGDLVHAVLVHDWDVVQRIQDWHADAQPGALVLLPVEPGPALRNLGAHPLTNRLRAEGPAAAWVDALVGGSEVLEGTGRVLRRPSGAVHLGGAASPTGPIRRRADLAQLSTDVFRQDAVLGEATRALVATRERLEALERETEEAAERWTAAQEAERLAAGARDDANRRLATLKRELHDSELSLGRIQERIGQAEQRLGEVDSGFTEAELSRARLDEQLGNARTALAALESDQEGAREARLQWQVQEAHLGARLRAAAERLERATHTIGEAGGAVQSLNQELAGLDLETRELSAQMSQWEEQRAEGRAALHAQRVALAQAEATLARADEALVGTERLLSDLRMNAELLTEEHHRLQLELTEVSASRRSIRERVEHEWRAPLERLLQGAQLLDLDLEALETESGRIVSSLEAIGPVNPLAVEEHAEETKRYEFLITQRDDLVAARQSLLQAIREIDGTARTMFLETFQAIQVNFVQVFQTLFGGGECELRLSLPDDPLESEIEIHAAPRGKRTQRIHLLSSGERTLVATSLLFAIYLTKPSPFCLMDEVDAPLDDANVGRFTTLLDEFKSRTQFLVITHNPRTMQAADAVYGVTMQEPGVSTIVGVRLGEHTPA